MFSLSNDQKEKLNIWLAEKYKNLIEEQRKTMSPEDFSLLTLDGKYPYTGAIGGGLTYQFTPTSLGVVTVVKFFDDAINLTDYDMW